MSLLCRCAHRELQTCLYLPYHLQSFPNTAKQITFCIYKHLFFSARSLCMSVPWCAGNPCQNLTVQFHGKYMKKIWLLCCPVKRKSHKFKSCHNMVICLFYIKVYYCNEITFVPMKDFDFFLCHLVDKQTN